MVLLIACTVGPKPIDYGHVACHYCSMTIVDKQHAAQLVTTKGKVFNFDAVECMMNQLKDWDESTIALFLANDFDRPGELIDATSATNRKWFIYFIFMINYGWNSAWEFLCGEKTCSTTDLF